MTAHFTVNDLGEAIAASPCGKIQVELPADDVFVREGVFDAAGKFRRRELARLLARLLKTQGRVRNTSNWWDLGTVHGRRIIYSDRPRANFAALNDSATSLVLGDNTALPPEGWKGRTELLSALLDIVDGEFAVNDERVLKLIPELARKRAPAGKNAARAQAKDARRRLLLSFTLEYVHEFVAGARADPRKLDAICIPSGGKVHKWMCERHRDAAPSPRTVHRDILDLCKSDARFGKIWRHLDDKRTYSPDAEELLKLMIDKTSA